MESNVLFGIDQLIEQAANYKNKRIGYVGNQASVARNGLHSRLAFLKTGFPIVKLFAPEHGFASTGADGAFINHQIDSATQVPIVSLYSEQLAPTEQDLEDLDLMLIDLPDIGARFYTYLWTMTYVMESCEKFNVPVLVLDRPNPQAHSLTLAEGPILQPSCASFIGRFPIPITHHCTFGELAQFFKAHYYPQLNLEILPLKNWSRAENQGYIFHPTSPAIQKRELIYTYPGACLFEGLNVQEGRGTDNPFAQFGAPWIRASELKTAVEKKLVDAEVKTVSYTSTMGLYIGEECHGLYIIPKEPHSFQSVNYFVKLIQIIHQLYSNHLQEPNYLTNVNPTGGNHLDKLLGIPNAFALLCQGKIDSHLKKEDWVERMQPYLLY